MDEQLQMNCHCHSYSEYSILIGRKSLGLFSITAALRAVLSVRKSQVTSNTLSNTYITVSTVRRLHWHTYSILLYCCEAVCKVMFNIYKSVCT